MNRAIILRVCIEIIGFQGTADRKKLLRYNSLMKYFGFIDLKRTVQYVLEFTYKKLSKNYFYKLCECHKTIKTLFLIPLESNLIHHLGHIYIQSPDQSSFKIKYFSIFSQIDQKEDSGELFRLTMDETIDHSSHKRLKKKRLE